MALRDDMGAQAAKWCQNSGSLHMTVQTAVLIGVSCPGRFSALGVL